MNNQQIMSVIRMLLVAVGTFLGTKYGIDAAQISSVADLVVAAIGAVGIAGSTIWSLYRNTHKATIAAAADLPSVTKIVVDDPAKAAAIPSAKVVS